MGGGPAVVSDGGGYAHLIDTRPWWKNSRKYFYAGVTVA